MRPKRKQRLYFVVLIVLGIGIAAALALTAFRENLLYFYSPSQVQAGEAPVGHKFRLGGLVVNGSVEREKDNLTIRFVLTDLKATIPVTYSGILPDLFSEGRGIVTHGKLDESGLFVAEEVLAKHDENYMPPEVADSLKAAGVDAHKATKNTKGGS